MIFKWVISQQLCHFIEPYHAPYVPKHRYWTGLLLFIRFALYLVFALNVSGDPGVNLLAIITSVVGLFMVKGQFGRVYQSAFVDAIEIYGSREVQSAAIRHHRRRCCRRHRRRHHRRRCRRYHRRYCRRHHRRRCRRHRRRHHRRCLRRRRRRRLCRKWRILGNISLRPTKRNILRQCSF